MKVLTMRFHDTRLAPGHRAWSPAASVALATLFAASADMLSAVVYWGVQGVAPERVFAAVARWSFDGPLPEAWIASLAGFATLALLYLPAVVAFDAWAASRRREAIGLAAGATWGLLIYAALFQCVVPAIVHPATLDRSAGWIATCLVMHGALIGPVIARLVQRKHSLPRQHTSTLATCASLRRP